MDGYDNPALSATGISNKGSGSSKYELSEKE
jgi:hypothetical protein